MNESDTKQSECRFTCAYCYQPISGNNYYQFSDDGQRFHNGCYKRYQADQKRNQKRKGR